MADRFEVVELTREECDSLLSAHRVGRLAYSFRDRVDIRPIMYVYRDGWLFGRTSEGSKLTTIRHNRWIAFQVDEVHDLWNWDSVVVRGAIHLLGVGGGASEEALRAQAIEALSDTAAETFAEDDPAPHRSVLFAVDPQEIEGRRARRSGSGPDTNEPDREDADP